MLYNMVFFEDFLRRIIVLISSLTAP